MSGFIHGSGGLGLRRSTKRDGSSLTFSSLIKNELKSLFRPYICYPVALRSEPLMVKALDLPFAQAPMAT